MIRFGIVGAGGIAEKFVRDCRVSNAEVVAIASRTLKKAKNFQERFDLKYAFGSYQEMAESDLIDAVYIATPHSHHAEHGILFMNHGKHVLAEKAITANATQFEEMVTVAKKNNVLLMEAMWSRFLPSSLFVLNESKNMGKLLHMDLEFGYSLLGGYPLSGRLLNPELAGGSILDIGVYPISFMFFMANQKVDKVVATGTLHETGVDVDAKMNVTFESGATAELRSTINEYYGKNAVFTYEKGTIEMIDFSRSTEVTINGVKKTIPFEGEGFVHQINSFVDTLNEGSTENHIMTYEASREVMVFMDEVRRQLNVKYPFE